MIKKRVLSIVAAAALIFTALIGFVGAPAKAEEAVKPIDMYLIGGQSNAAGYSLASKGNVDGSFSNVMYAGEVDKRLDDTSVGGGINLNSYATYKKAVTVGCGVRNGYIGPEFGMAKTLNSYYSGDKKAIIFKSAAGGTALQNKNSGLSATYGNWYPRSMWKTGFTPDASVSPTGVQYKNFVDNFRQVYNTLKMNGYEPKVKGMVWMQGEDDLGAASAYKPLIEAFISDVREDIAEITCDRDNEVMPFVIGEIATTFAVYNNPNVPEFNKMQREVAAETAGVYTAPTDDLIIVGKNGVEGTDLYHFSGTDMVTLGERFAEKLIAATDETLVSLTVSGKKGNAVYKFSDDKSKVTITLKPEKNYKASSVLVNGVEFVDKVQDNELTFDVGDEKRIAVKVKFGKKSALAVTVECGEGGRAEAETPVYEGDRIAVTVKPDAGYKVKSVSIDGVELALNAETGKYESEPVTTASTVKVEFERETVADDGKSGCGGKNAALAIGVALAVAALALKRG